MNGKINILLNYNFKDKGKKIKSKVVFFISLIFNKWVNNSYNIILYVGVFHYTLNQILAFLPPLMNF